MTFYRHQLSMLRCVSMCVSFVKHHELAHWARIWRNVSSLFYLSYADAEQTMKYILQDSFMNRLQLECYNDITSVNNWFSFIFWDIFMCICLSSSVLTHAWQSTMNQKKKYSHFKNSSVFFCHVSRFQVSINGHSSKLLNNLWAPVPAICFFMVYVIYE